MSSARYWSDETGAGPLRHSSARHGKTRTRRALQLATRILLAVLCLGLLTAPFPVAFYLQHRAELYGQQLSTPPAQLPGEELERYRSAAQAAPPEQHTAPIILSYHDIRPTSGDEPYVVSPSAFAAQMKMLDRAGYRTLSTDEFARYLEGGPVPSRSVLITFDDGTQGLWTYADQILARHGFNAVSFLITGRVSEDQEYYLNWAQVQRMRASGRWDFGSHTRDLHTRVPVAGSDEPASPLTNRRILPGRGRPEDMAAFRSRVRRDLTASIRDMTAHGLPRPRLFAYPFSEEATASGGSAAARSASRIIDDLFVATMTNDSSPSVISRQVIASGLLPRLEVVAGDTAGEVFARMQAMEPLRISDRESFHHAGNWVDYGGDPAGVTMPGKRLEFHAKRETYGYAAYAPRRTTGWEGYAFSARATRLLSSDSATATLVTRLGNSRETTVNISDDTLRVYVGRDSGRHLVHEAGLYPSDNHRITVEVAAGATRVLVDGSESFSTQSRPTPRDSGGVAVAANRGAPGEPFVGFTELTVKEVGQP